jgi:hypothetical protein
MKWLKRNRQSLSPDIVHEWMQFSGNVRYPTYINEWKISQLFDQCLFGITEFVKKHSREKGMKIGSKISLGGILKLLNTNIDLDTSLESTSFESIETKMELTPGIKFLLLERFLEENKLISDLNERSPKQCLPINTLIRIKGKFDIWRYQSKDSVHVLSALLQDNAAVKTIIAQKEQEEKLENEEHFVYVMTKPVLAASIFSSRFTTNFGFRDIYGSPNTTFFGRTLGYLDRILFLDPIIVWVGN